MFCPHDVNTGFIQLVGPIQQTDLNNITVKSYPLSISFAPRTTPPTLIGNRIDESTENTCTYKGKRFSLVDVQICSPLSKGYVLPGIVETPVAELVLSFSVNGGSSDLSSLSGIIMCIPIYDSGSPSHNEYLLQLVDSSIPSCKYTHLVGSDYSGADYQTLSNSNLTQCIKSCCGDTNCLAYTFNSGTCYLKNSIPNLTKTGNNNIVSGTVNHNTPTCSLSTENKKEKKKNTKLGVPNLESIFYDWDGDTSQSSIAYVTCFETIDSNNLPTSRSLYVVVFPNGIHLSSSSFQQLLLQLNGTLVPYSMPPAIRGGEATLQNYNFDDDGNKVPTQISNDGIIYATPLSSCTDEFRHRFEYFTKPPRLPANISSSLNSEKCPYYKTTQYKCVPFNQLKDLSGEYVVPGNKTLDTILFEQQQAKAIQSGGDITEQGISTEQIETIIASVAGVLIAGIIVLKVGSWISKNA